LAVPPAQHSTASGIEAHLCGGHFPQKVVILVRVILEVEGGRRAV